ncbi:MAG: acyl-CoA dehydrogenase family protein [Acidobacteriaceae bacterium]
MSTETVLHSSRKVSGGAFLVDDLLPEEIFTPEDLSAEQKQMAEITADFAEKQILGNIQEIEAKNYSLSRKLMRDLGELGLLSVDVPEDYGGMGLGQVTSALLTDRIAVSGSFAVTFSAHVGIGMLPLIWYGTPEQKQKYLPKLASGEWIASYALSEASAGSDAMNIHTRATLSPDGKNYLLNGEKMWISNASMAGLFTIFAKVDGEQFTAFLVEAGTPGLTVGPEEHKLGIRGSSTCPLALVDCAVPVENVLGEIGKGHHIAFNVLDVGRYKLAAAAVGGSRTVLRDGIRYGRDRIAFGKPVTSFGLIQEKIAETAADIYACEAAVYRTVGAIDAAMPEGEKSPQQIQKAIGEFAVECSILKFWGSEMLERAVDKMLQIFGGYGYVEEFPVERAYRDSRINKIFEGTNEINRLITTGWMIKRAMQGRLALLPAIKKVMDEVMAGPTLQAPPSGVLGTERNLVRNAKKLGLFCSGVASQRFGTELSEQQEVVGMLADMLAEIMVSESVLLRAEKSAERMPMGVRLAKYFIANSFRRMVLLAEKLVAAIAEGDTLRTQMAIVRRLAKHEPVNTVTLGREIAATMVAAGRYTIEEVRG